MSKTEVKIILVGDANVGKTSIVTRYVKGTYETGIAPTIGAAFLTKDFNDDYLLNIWDTAGQEQYHFLVPMYYRNSQIVILVFDLTSAKTFQGTSRWIKELREGVGDQCVTVLVGSKSDLEESREVSDEEAQMLATDNNFLYFEVSSLTGDCINLLFEQAMDKFIKACEQNAELEAAEPATVSIDVTEERNKKGGCC